MNKISDETHKERMSFGGNVYSFHYLEACTFKFLSEQQKRNIAMQASNEYIKRKKNKCNRPST